MSNQPTTVSDNLLPSPKKRPYTMSVHNHTRVDEYFWMRLTDEQKESENPDDQTREVLQFLENENSYREKIWKPLQAFEDTLFMEIKSRIKQDDMSYPYKLRGYWYIKRYETGKEYVIHSRKKESLEAEEEIFLDENKEAEGKSYYATSGLTISPDDTMLAYGEDTVGRRKYTLKIKNLNTHLYLPEEIKDTSGNIVWCNDNKTIFYTKNDSTLRPYKVFKHTLGTDPASDVEIFHEKDDSFHCYIYASRSKKYIIICSTSTVSDECSWIDANDPSKPPVLLQKRIRNLEYKADHFEGKWYFRTNKDEAKNFKLMISTEENTEKDSWKDLIQHRNDILLEGFELFTNYLVLSERVDGNTKIRIIHKSNSDYYINFDEESYVANVSVNPEPDCENLRVAFTSLTTPSTLYDCHMKSGGLTVLKVQEIVGGYDRNLYKSERLYAVAHDGEKIPISIVYRKDLAKDSMPLLLYGYGSYGISIDPTFSSTRLSILDRGFGFAIAHIRGGEDMGRRWYEEGKLLKKKNTFTDFISCGEFLIEKGYTSKDKLFAMGGSAGGLLIGVVVNMRPDLWKGVIAAVPFLDVVTTMLDETIPLTTGEYDEWGNPTQKEFYDYMASYSPYDNIEKKDYPAMLVTTGYHDSQVQYWEPAKYVAKLRDYKTDNQPLLLYCNMTVGHGGASGRFERIKEIAKEYTFLLWQAGKIEYQAFDKD
jgi:oligopeptidase B